MGTPSAVDFEMAAAEIARRDPALGRVVSAVGPAQLRAPQDDPFASLVRAIVFQQLAGRAAAAIHGRFVEALGGTVSAGAVLALPSRPSGRRACRGPRPPRSEISPPGWPTAACRWTGSTR